MDEILKQLKNDTNDFTCRVADACLRLHTNWHGRTPGVSRVVVRLEGVEPLTGRKLPDDYLTARFDRLTTEYTSPKLPLYGRYELCLEGFDEHGNSLGIFRRTPLEIRNPNCRPQMSYSVRSAGDGWSRVELRTNYLERVRGHLWLEYDRRRYLVTAGAGRGGSGKLTLYVPAADARIIQEDETLPEPQRL